MEKRKRRIKILVTLTAAALLFAAVAQAATTLGWGSTGTDVRRVQQLLRQWGYYDGQVDGVYGQQTYNAVIHFQRANGLTADGKVGAETAAALGIALDSANGNYTSADLTLLARVIYAEARGESYTGQVAVGAVVLNRVKSALFPNTIAGVVYQKDAFTCVNDGQINLTPDATAYSAAQDALNGWDPTGGCLYYYNASTAVSAWIYSRPTIMIIGRHTFAL